jgi:hypothetical protein
MCLKAGSSFDARLKRSLLATPSTTTATATTTTSTHQHISINAASSRIVKVNILPIQPLQVPDAK